MYIGGLFSCARCCNCDQFKFLYYAFSLHNDKTKVRHPPAFFVGAEQVEVMATGCAIIKENKRTIHSLYMLGDEQSLISQAQNGQREAFGQLYDHYSAPIYRFVALKVGSKEEAEDLTHETFLSAWQNLKNYKHQGFPFSSWLYQIARNKVIDHYRTKKQYTSFENLDEDILKIVGVVENNLEVSLAMDQVKQAIAQLGQEQQDVIIMKFVEDLPNEEIAKALNKSEGAVRLLQHRAVQNLKEILWKSQ